MSRADSVVLTAEGQTCRLEIFDSTVERLKALTPCSRGIILIDQAFEAEARSWCDNFPGFIIVFPGAAGEAVKSLTQADKILKIMAGASLNRDDWLIVRGGGSLTDLGGFCAGLYRRGMRLILVPTTLLGAADAAVGGKTAVNFSGAKNQLGHFYLPEFVLTDLTAISRLPRERLADGLVEVYKTGLLFDDILSDLVENRNEELLTGDRQLLTEVIYRSVRAKASVVEQDFREEKKIRDVLNLGHTYGHVAESFYCGLSHGAAVAQGLAVMAEMSRSRGLPDDDASRITAVARNLSGPWPDPPPEAEVRRLLLADKKSRGGGLRFVVLKALRHPAVIDVSPDEVLQAAEKVLAAAVDI